MGGYIMVVVIGISSIWGTFQPRHEPDLERSFSHIWKMQKSSFDDGKCDK